MVFFLQIVVKMIKKARGWACSLIRLADAATGTNIAESVILNTKVERIIVFR